MEDSYDEQRQRPHSPEIYFDATLDEPEEELSFRAKKARSQRKLKSTFDSIYEKYGQDFTGIGDEIDLETGLIVVDNGHLQGMEREGDNGNIDALASPQKKRKRGRQSRWSTWTPVVPNKKQRHSSDVDEEAETTDEGAEEPVYEDVLLEQIRHRGDRQRSQSHAPTEHRPATPTVYRDEPLSDEPLSSWTARRDQQLQNEESHSQPEEPVSSSNVRDARPLHRIEGTRWTGPELQRFIYLRNHGFAFIQMVPFFDGKQEGTLEEMWMHLLRFHPELDQRQPPSALLARGLADLDAGRLDTHIEVKRNKRPFSRTEDELLVRLRQSGMPWSEIEAQFTDRHRSADSLRRRMDALCTVRPELIAIRGKPAAAEQSLKRRAYVEFTPEEDSLVLQLRAKGVKFRAMTQLCGGRGENTIRQRYVFLCTGAYSYRKSSQKAPYLKDPIRLDPAVLQYNDHAVSFSYSKESSPDSIVGARRPFDKTLDEEDSTNIAEREFPENGSDFLESDNGRRDQPIQRSPRRSQIRTSSPSLHLFANAQGGHEEAINEPTRLRRRSDTPEANRSSAADAAKISITGAGSRRPSPRRELSHLNPLPTPQTSASDCSPGPEQISRGPGISIIDLTSSDHEQREDQDMFPGDEPTRLPGLHFASYRGHGSHEASHIEFDDDGFRNSNSVRVEQPVGDGPFGQHLPEQFSNTHDFAPESTEDADLPLFCIDSDPSTPISPTLRLDSAVVSEPQMTLVHKREIEDTEHETSLSAMPSSLEVAHEKPVIEVQSDFVTKVQPDIDQEEKQSNSGQLRIDTPLDSEEEDPTFYDAEYLREQEEGLARFRPSSTVAQQPYIVEGTVDDDDKMDDSLIPADEPSHDGQQADDGDECVVPDESTETIHSFKREVSATPVRTTDVPRPRERSRKDGKVSLFRKPSKGILLVSSWQREEIAGTSATESNPNPREKVPSKRLSLPKVDGEVTDDEIGQIDNTPKPHKLSFTPRSIPLRRSLPSKLAANTPVRQALQRSAFGDEESSEDELCTPGKFVAR